MRKQGGKTWWIDKDSGAGWANVFLKVYNSAEAEHAVHRSEVDGMQEASDSLRHERQPKNCKDFIGVSVYFLGATPITRTSLKSPTFQYGWVVESRIRLIILVK